MSKNMYPKKKDKTKNFFLIMDKFLRRMGVIEEYVVEFLFIIFKKKFIL